MAPRRPTAPRTGKPARTGPAAAARPVATGRPAPGRIPAARSTAGRASAGRPAGGSRPGQPGSPRVGTAPGSGRPAVQAAARASVRRTPPLVRPVTLISGVLVVLALLLAPYVRPWLAQRSAITAGAQEVARLQAEVDALQDERRRWDDPAFIRRQAGERLHMAMPGEIRYRRLAPPATRAPADPRAATAAVPSPTGLPWWKTVADSVVRAGDPAGR